MSEVRAAQRARGRESERRTQESDDGTESSWAKEGHRESAEFTGAVASTDSTRSTQRARRGCGKNTRIRASLALGATLVPDTPNVDATRHDRDATRRQAPQSARRVRRYHFVWLSLGRVVRVCMCMCVCDKCDRSPKFRGSTEHEGRCAGVRIRSRGGRNARDGCLTSRRPGKRPLLRGRSRHDHDDERGLGGSRE